MEAQQKTVMSPADAVAAGIKDGKTHLLLASSGSVATIKLPLIISELATYPNLSIRVILTESAKHFLAGQSDEQPTVASLSALPNVDGVYQDQDEWTVPWTRGASILHIELRRQVSPPGIVFTGALCSVLCSTNEVIRWAHLLAVVPLSANTLAKITCGMADSLLTNVCRAWNISPDNPRRPRILVAPAMNTQMWNHPITETQIRKLDDEWGVNGRNPSTGWYEVLLPQASKLLACGDRGTGAMLEWKEIVTIIKGRLGLYQHEQDPAGP